MTLFPYTNAPIFVAGDQVPVTAGITTLERNIEQMDFITRAGRDVAQGHAPGDNIEQIGANPLEWWQGGFRYRSGMTSLTVVMENVGVIAGGVVPRLRIELNGVIVQTTALASGVQTITFGGLAAQGYPDGQVVAVTLQIIDLNPDQPGLSYPVSGWPGRFHFLDCYVAPVSAAMTSVWPGTPTFTLAAGFETAKLNQLANACDWLALRLNLVPMNLFQALRFATGLHWKITPDPEGRWSGGYPIWTGGLGAGRGVLDRLKLELSYSIVLNSQEALTLRINGVNVSTIGPFNAGDRGLHTFDVSLAGYASTTPLRIQLVSTIAGDNPPNTPGRPSRYTIRRCWAERSGVAALPAIQETFSAELVSYQTAIARLNQISSALAALKSRIDGAPDLYDRARVFRRGYGYNGGERAYYATRHVPTRLNRIGAGLIVFGANTTLGYGLQTIVPPAEKEPDGEYGVKFAYEEGIIAGDQQAMKIIALDALDGLTDSSTYQLMSGGDSIVFAAEYLLR